MNIVRRKPFNFSEDFNDLLKQWYDPQGDHSNIATSEWSPHVDIAEKEKAFIIYADIPGVDPKDIDISMENNILSIKGERCHESKEQKDNYSRVERRHGIFYRRFSLPDTADSEHISAQSRHGVLQITIPKKEEKIKRNIQVESV